MTLEELKKVVEGLDEESKFYAKPLIEVIEKNPKNPQPYLRLSELFWKSHNAELAKDVLKSVLEFDPENEVVKRKLEWIEGFGIRPTAISGRLAEEKLEKRTTIIVRAITIALAAFGVLIVALIVKLIFFKPAYRLAKGDDNFVAVRFSPDGKRLAFTQSPYFSPFDALDILDKWPQKAQIFVSEIDGKNKKVVHEILVYPFETPQYVWLKEGMWLAISPTLKETSDDVIAIDVKSNSKRIIATGGKIWASPDGNFFCYLLATSSDLSARKDLVLVNEDKSENIIASGHINEVAMSERASVIAYTTLELPTYSTNILSEGIEEGDYEPLVFGKVAFAFSFEKAQTVQISKKGQNVSSLAISNDGKKVAFINSSQRQQELIVSDLDGNQTVIFRTSDDFPWIGTPVFSPDGRYLIFEAAMAKSTEAIKELTIKLPQVEKRLKTMKQLSGGFSVWSFASDLFYVDLAQAQPQVKRYELKNHRFKHKPAFHPSGSLIAFEQTTLDFRTEAWIAKFNLK